MISRNALIALALAPASMELKRRLRGPGLSAQSLRLCYRREAEAAPGLIVAWLYWLTDGNPAGVELYPSGHEQEWLVVMTIEDGTTPQLEFLSNGGDRAELRIDKVSLALPEGDGGYYRRLEIEEMGASRMLPDTVIDECIDFADALSEVFHENRPFLL